MKKNLIKIALIVTLLISLGAVANAYSINNDFRPQNLPFGFEYETDTPADNTIFILQIIAGGLLYFAAPIAIIMIAISGWSMIVGGAETDKVDQAKKNLTWAVVGLLVIILSYSIVRAVINFVIKAGDVETTTIEVPVAPDPPKEPAE